MASGPATPSAQAEAMEQTGPAPLHEVTLGENAPELEHMTIETVRAVTLPTEEIVAPAKIEANPNRVAHAVLPVPGRIVKVMVQLGDSVKAGQPVVSIDSPAVGEAQSAYIQADASVRQAELAITKAEADLARVADLFEHQAIAQKEVLAAQTTVSLSKATLEQQLSVREQARRRLELLGLTPGEFQQRVLVHAPISGKVLEIAVVDGEYHNEINTPLITIADLSRVWATSEAPESNIRAYKIGGMMTLDLIAYPGETFQAKVTRIADTVDPQTRTIEVSAELKNPDGRLRPEMFGQLRYAGGMAPAIWIPENAVIESDDAKLVFLETSPGRFMPTPVELGRRHDDGFVVNAGLRPGEKVVTSGAVYLKALL
ncbi:MAG: efflux RND transporter periplasmic adaptor subunit [Bryobacterales bacterium]